MNIDDLVAVLDRESDTTDSLHSWELVANSDVVRVAAPTGETFETLVEAQRAADILEIDLRQAAGDAVVTRIEVRAETDLDTQDFDSPENNRYRGAVLVIFRRDTDPSD